MKEASSDPGHARSLSGSALYSRSNSEDPQPADLSSLSLPEGRQSCPAKPSQDGVSTYSTRLSNSSFRDSGLAGLNRPQGSVPAVPGQDGDSAPLNRPEGVVPSMPAGDVGTDSSSACKAQQLASSKPPSPSINADRPAGTAGEHDRAEDGGSQHQESSLIAVSNCGQPPEQCIREEPQKQGCAACVQKYQQQAQAGQQERVALGERISARPRPKAGLQVHIHTLT